MSFRVIRVALVGSIAAGLVLVSDDLCARIPTGTPARMFRGGAARHGTYPGPGPERLGAIAWTFQTGGPVRSSPVVADGSLFVGSHDGHLYALDPASGRLRWRTALDAPVIGSPA